MDAKKKENHGYFEVSAGHELGLLSLARHQNACFSADLSLMRPCFRQTSILCLGEALYIIRKR